MTAPTEPTLFGTIFDEVSEGPPLTVLANGHGQDSGALLAMSLYDAGFRERYCPNYYVVCGSDTGRETPQTYEWVEYARGLCEEAGVEYHYLTPDLGFHTAAWRTLLDQYRRNDTCGSKAYRKTCSLQLKMYPFYRWLGAWLAERIPITAAGPNALYDFVRLTGRRVRVLIGFAKGEESRIAPDSRLDDYVRDCVERVYPLIDMGVDRAGAREIISGFGMKVPWPSSCTLCPFTSEPELVWLARRMPEEFALWVELERNKLAKFAARGVAPEKNLGVWAALKEGRAKTLPEVLGEALERYGHLSDEEIDRIRFTHGHGVKTCF